MLLSRNGTFRSRNTLRLYSNKETQKTESYNEKPNPELIKQDYIGPPDKDSNLRPYVRYIPNSETPLAKMLRNKRVEVEIWNQDFWSKHNKRFYEEKEDFIKIHHEAGSTDISADEMSVFYKHFLDKNKKIHALYNLSWYIKNFELLLLAFRVALQKLLKRRKL
ncbi:COA8 family protein CG14806, mitochondrial [Glossina fuscipes]|uniref:COA8 family protein CG14806, mitochondrial n=1 Tax=Glossina fuscipes TaxID=7396 RepID=A0A9C6DMS1_9MUSC|nr:COA8 family protein CG14806, mitochondrial [Glossina fuscipes]